MRWTASAESSGIRGTLPVEPGAGVLGLPPVESGAGWDGAGIRGFPPVEPGGGWYGIPASGGVAAPWDKKGEETAALPVRL